ncbi:MAG: hypothetical protein ABIH00_10915, partial [Armatimonadota bacterium]
NNFTYNDPYSLPGGYPEDSLSSEPHNFSRLFTATVYDCLEDFFKQNLAKTSNQLSSLKTAASDLSKIFSYAVELSPPTRCKYKDIAIGMLKADKQITNGKYQDVMEKIFLERKILNSTDLKKKDIPDLKLNKPLKTKEDALDFIKQNKDNLNISIPLNLKTDSIYTNKNGETFISYSSVKEVPVKGDGLEKYKGCFTMISGGFTLAFDNQGKLMNFTQDLIDETKIRDAMDEIKGYDKSGLILDTHRKSGTDKLYRAVIKEPYGKSHKKILQKIPVIE